MKLFGIVIACMVPVGVASQTVPPSPAVPLPALDAKSLEKAAASLGKPSARVTTTNEPPPADTPNAIALLREVRVTDVLLGKEISDYWLPDLRKPVSAEKLVAFRNWVYELLDDRGYLASVDISEEAIDDGSTLVVSVKPMRLGQTRMVVTEGYDQGKAYVDEIARRFNQRFKAGSLLDVLELEAQLNAAAYDLPVDLSVFVRTVQPGVGDAYINVTLLEPKPLTFQSGALQVNNFGLNQYGREQALGVARFEGLTTQSVATLATQVTQNVALYRVEYDMPLYGWNTRLRAWSSGSESKTSVNNLTSARNNAGDFGLGLSVMLDTTRYGSSQFVPEWNSHWSRDFTQGSQDLETAKFADNQFRLKFKSENYRGLFDSFKNEIAWIVGEVDIQNASELFADQGSYNRNGAYQKWEINGELASMLSREALVKGSVRWRGQWANKNLMVYHRIAFGGTSGIRAYSTADGVADEGIGLFFDVNKRFSENFYAGVLYDLAWLNVAKNKPSTTTSSNNYTLQGVGFQLGGEVSKFNWVMSVAKSLGDAQDSSTDSSLTPLGTWRVNFELTRPF